MRLGRIFSGLAMTVVVLALAFFAGEWHWYVGFIPPQIRTAGAVRISWTTDFILSGCGVAIFRLTAATRDAIRAQGLAFLASARVAKRTAYEPWAQTPMRAELLGGFSCANVRRSLSDSVFEGASKPGSFFTMQGQSTLLVIPESKLVVFSYLR